MDRLTKRVGVGEAITIGDFDICAPFIKSGYCKTGMQSGFPRKWERHCNDTCVLGLLIDRLAAYEDTGLMPEEIVRMGMAFEDSKRYSGRLEGKLKAWDQANRDGRLHVSPCKMGDTLYMIVTKRPKINMPEFSFIKTTYLTEHNFFRVIRDYGKTVFLTREAAEAAMEEAGHGEV